MLTLVDGSVPARGIDSSSFIVGEALHAAGWEPRRQRLGIRGAMLVTFFETKTPWLAHIARQCRNWLGGGWLDERTCAALQEELARDRELFEKEIPKVAAMWADVVAPSKAELEEAAHSGLSKLRAMLAQANHDLALWIIED
jgi:hypothetical protein